MLKKKINGTWTDISTLKKRDNGAWSYISSLKKKVNGAWSDLFFNWFNILSYSIDSGCTGSIATTTNGAIEIRNYIVYGNSCIVRATLGKFNAVAGDTVSIDYSYDLYPYATGSSHAIGTIANKTIFDDNAYPWEHNITSNTFNYTFSQSINNVELYLFLHAYSTGTSYGPVESKLSILNIYINGVRINYDTIKITQ